MKNFIPSKRFKAFSELSFMPIKTSRTEEKKFPSVSMYESVADILVDHELAALGDAYVNFVYSLALSRKRGKPLGRKVDSATLASALRKAGVRKLLPSRTDRHKQADAAEALIVYAWLSGVITFEETVNIVENEETGEDAFSLLLKAILDKLRLPHKKI